MDNWDEGTHYEDFMGRWSLPVAREFLTWLEIPPDSAWLDVGCGTGALTTTIAEYARPLRLSGVDPSAAFIATAHDRLGDRADLRVGDALALPFGDQDFDAVVSGLVLNFVSDPEAALGEMGRVAKTGGLVAAYVWDYAEGMEMIRTFWDVAVELDPSVGHLHEATRFPLCHPDRLIGLFEAVGLAGAEVTALEVPTRFRDFEDLWSPLHGRQGPAPTYLHTLGTDERRRFRTALRQAVPEAPDGISLTARAWAIKGTT